MINLYIIDYKAIIFFIIKYKLKIKTNKNKIANIRSLGILNKFLNGVKITKIRPVTLLIKNRG